MNFRSPLAVSLIALAIMRSAALAEDADHSAHHGTTDRPAQQPSAGGCPMMGQGMMSGGMMGGGMMGRRGMQGMTGIGPGKTGETAQGMARIFGSRVTPIMNLSVEDVRGYLTTQLDRLNNKRLKIGDIKTDTGSISADIVTIDNSLVQRLRVNRHTGAIDYED